VVQSAVSRRQLIEDARQAALEGRWEEAIALNQQVLERAPRDAEAHNRLGRALLALGRYTEASEAYSEALRADPANLIARRNLQRLETLRHRGDSPSATLADSEEALTGAPRTTVFIEEVGKTWVDELVNPIGIDVLAGIYPAEQLELVIDGNRLVITTKDGQRLGEIEAKTAERVIQLTQGGNRYEVYSLGLSAQSLRVILREVYHDPALASQVSFPRQLTSRAYLRERDLLRQRDEADFYFSDDDEEDDEAATAEADEEEATDADGDQFVDETVTVVEEDENPI
jgi:tetratricopeptide (TPR) repeat protein